MEWLGEVPEQWKVGRLGFEAKTIVPMRDKPEDLNGEIPWIRIEDFSGKTIEGSKSGQGVSNEIIQKMNLKVFPIGTVLCSCSCKMGATAIVTKPLVTNQTFIGIVPNHRYSSEYLYYLMQIMGVQLESIATGAIQQYLSRDDFRRLRLPLPDIKEQLLISSFLDRETFRIDTLISEKERLISLLQEYRQALISQAVTKGLDPNVKMKDSGVEWLGEVPEHWGFSSLNRIAERVVVGIAEAATHAYAEHGVPILRSTNIRACGEIGGEILRIDPKFAEDRGSKLIKAGDLVTVRTGNAGITAVVPPYLDECQCFTMLITTLRANSNSSYYCNYMNSFSARYYFNIEGWGTAQVNISVPILKALPVPIPPLEEQTAITAFLDRETTRIDTLISEARKFIDLLKEYRSSLITAAVTGKIDVREVVPSGSEKREIAHE